jgi:hypothetical protein
MKIETGKLNQKAIIIHLSMSQWYGYAKDRTVTNEVSTIKHASSNVGNWSTYLVPKSSLLPVRQGFLELERTFKKWTLPWTDGAYRILASKSLFKFREDIHKAGKKVITAYENFIKEYPKIIASPENKKRLGDLAHSIQFPTIDELRNRFGYRLEYLPVPDKNDFRADVNEEEVEMIKNEIEQTVNNTYSAAMSDIWNRLNNMVGKVVDTLKDDDKVFRDSLITNIKDFCDFIPNINLIGDERLEEMRRETVTKLALLQPSNLRNDKQERKQAVKKAKELLKKFDEYKF